MGQSNVRALRAPVSRFGGLPLPLEPRGRAIALAQGLARLERLREEMAAKAIAELDALTGDPDFEPVNGAGEVQSLRRGPGLDQRHWADGGDQGEREPEEDAEPSLGSVGAEYAGFDQSRWGTGSTEDLEGEHDGREPSEDYEHPLGRSENLDQTRQEYGEDDREPSLGASAGVDQSNWGDRDSSDFPFSDLEAQCEDEGAHDDREPEDGW